MSLFSDIDFDDIPPPGTFLHNSLSYLYCTLTGIWIFLIIVFTIWIYYNRSNGSVRLRNMPITVLTVWTCSVIIVFNLMQYPMNGSVPCDIEFWIYSIFFPLSVVFMQAKNTQLYIIFAKNLDAYLSRRNKTPKLLPHKVKKYMIKGGVDVMIFHIVATSFIYIFSTRFNPRGVIKGSNESDPELACHDGWEWYPKHLGLLIYTYIVGPMLIYSLQKIEDTHKMKLEILTIILTSWACLPLFIFSYKHESFKGLNTVIPPLLWFNLSLVSICVICFAFPAYEMYRTMILRKQEVRNTRGIFTKILDANISQDFSKVLSDPIEFQKFAAFTVKDLSIENPLFFEKVMRWRKGACIAYDVDPGISEKEFKKLAMTKGVQSYDNKGSNGNLLPSHASNSAASTAYSEMGSYQPHTKICTNPDGNIIPTQDNALSKIGTQGADRDQILSRFSYNSPQTFFNETSSSKCFLIESLDPIFERQDRFGDFNPPKHSIRTDKIKDMHVRKGLKDECHRLVQEFIVSDAPLSINIVASTRKAILSSFESERGYQIVFIFDRAIAEVVELMYTNSYLRYLSTKNRNNKYNLPLFKK